MWGCGAEGARLLGMEEVTGSSPVSSTIKYLLFLKMRVVPRDTASRPLGMRGFCVVRRITFLVYKVELIQ